MIRIHFREVLSDFDRKACKKKSWCNLVRGDYNARVYALP